MTPYEILVNCEDLLKLLPHGNRSIYKDQNPAAGDYPSVVVVTNSTTPAAHADNKPYDFRKGVSVFVFTKFGNDEEFDRIIFDALTQKDFSYTGSERTIEYDMHVLRAGYEYISDEL